MTELISRLRANLRQRRFPPEHRIAAGDPAAWAARLQAAVDALQAAAPAAESPPAGVPDDLAAHLADLATSLWRARRRLDGADRPPDRMVNRHLGASWSALRNAGVTVQEHEAMPFDPGQVLEVLAFQPTAGLTRETVVETIRPSVYLDDRHIQIGQVIVGQPPGTATGTEDQTAEGNHR